jgi:hypothetical protein
MAEPNGRLAPGTAKLRDRLSARIGNSCGGGQVSSGSGGVGGADAVSYPTTTPCTPTAHNHPPVHLRLRAARLAQVRRAPARLTGPGLLTMTLPSPSARPMWTPAHGQLRQPGYSVKQRTVNPPRRSLLLLLGVRGPGRLRPGRQADLEGRQLGPGRLPHRDALRATLPPKMHEAAFRRYRSASGSRWRTPGCPMGPGRRAPTPWIGRSPATARPGRRHRDRPAPRPPLPAVGRARGAWD